MIYIGSAKGVKYGVKKELLYNHKLGWRVIRAKDKVVANALADYMIMACNNSHLKYNQAKRHEVLQHGISKQFNVCCDCSSLLTYIVRIATGVDIPVFTTATGANKLLRTGLFEEVPYYKDALCNGDILITRVQGHCAVVVSGAGSVTNYQVPLPTLKKGSRGTEVVKLQRSLNKFGAFLESDGIFGNDTKKAVQEWQYTNGLKPDGIYGPKSFDKLQGMV